jgi:minor histocompatibility antigen H13
VPAGGAEGVAPATPSRPFNMLGLGAQQRMRMPPGACLHHSSPADIQPSLNSGDIVVPGIFIALVLRMDVARAAAPPPAVPPRARYFHSVMIGYVSGLGTTIAVMNIFNAAQPALLYIVPALLLSVAARAAAAGELKVVAAWEEGSGEEEKAAEEAVEVSKEPDKVAADSGGEGSADGWVKLPKSAKKAEPKKAK